MKTIRKILVAICVLAMVFSTLSTPVYAASSQSSPNTIVRNNSTQLTSFLDWFGGWFGYAKNPSLNKTSLSLEKGGAYTLRTSNMKGSVSWTSSDTDVVTVSKSGYVKAINPGDATVTAKSGNISLTCEIHVYGAEFTPENIELAVGEKVTLRATLNGRAMSLSRISSADSRIAKVTNRGVITAVSAGTTTIGVNVHGVRYDVPVTVKSPTEITVTDLTEDEITVARNSIEAYLYTQNLQLVEVLKAVDVSVKNATGNVEVVVDNVNVEDLNNVHLYHIDDDVNVEELDFTVQNDKLTFVSDSFSPFVLARTEELVTEATPVGLRIEVTTDTTVYTHQRLFTSHGELAFPEGYNAYVQYSDGSEMALSNGVLVEIEPWCAPAEEGQFDCTFSYTCEDGTVVSDTITLNAVHAEPVMSTSGASYAAGLRGNVNGKSLKHIIFTDTIEPADDECATKAYIGQLESHAVIAYRLNGQEDTLYITSGRPGVKVIHSGEGGTINSGFVDDVDCRMLDTSRCTTTTLFWANGGAFQHGVKSINYSGCDFSNVTSLGAAFNTYTSLQYLDLSNCDFSNVESLSYMCYNTPNLIKLDMSGTKWGEGKVTNLEYAFGGSGLQEIDLGGLETSAVTTVQGMFVKDKNLKTVDLSRCDFSQVTDAAYMFQECGELTSIAMPTSGMPKLQDSIRQMFDVCVKLSDVDLSGLNFSKVSNVFRAFYRCESLRTTLNIDATLFDKSYGYTFADMAIGDGADVVINCTQASKDILDDHMIWATNVQYTQHVTYHITDAPTVNPLSDAKLDEALSQINNALVSDGKIVDQVVYAADISSNGSNKVELDLVDVPEGAILYHVNEDDTVNEVPYTLENDKLIFTSDAFSPFVLVTTKDAETDVEQTDDGYVVVTPVDRVSDCNIAFMEKSWFEEPDAFIKGFGSTLQGYMLTYRDADGNVVVPNEPKTVVIENVDFSQFNTDDEIVLAYTYIDPNVSNGNNNGVMYMDSVPYEYDAENHRVTFEFNAFQPYYGNIEICQGGHRDLVVDESHGELTWSVNNNCEWGDVLVDQNGRVEVWGSFDNIEVTATDGNKSWVWLINVSSNDIINRNLVVNVGETFYCYGYDDMRAGSYVSSEISDDGRIDYSHECGAIRDNGDGTATALKPGTYNLAIGFKYFLGQEGYSIQFGSITIVGDEQTAPSITPLDETTLNNVLDQLNAHLSAENKVVDQVALAVDVVPNGNTSIDIESVEALDGAVLYHISDDGTITTVPYTLVDGTLHFENDEFSPYLLVTTKDLPTVTIDPAFLGVWQAQGTSILWVVDIHDDGTFDSYYPNYPQGNTSATYSISEDGKTIELFEQYFSFDEYGNLTDAEWNASEHHAQRIMTRFENIMGWWRTDDSFVDGEIYPAEDKGFYLQEEEYGKTYSLDSEGHLTFFNNNEDIFYYDVDNDCIVAQHADGTQSILHRWIDTYVR